MSEPMTQEERTIAVAQSISQIDDLLNIEQLVLAAWPSNAVGWFPGYKEQSTRVATLEKARASFACQLATPATSA